MKTIYIVGDSTVDTNTPPYYGWGGQLEPLTNGWIVVNLAKSGASSKSFLDEGLFEPARENMREGDLLLIGFGHNDEKDDEARHTDPSSTFPETLMKYVSAAREANAIPVLCTSVSRRFFVGAQSEFLMYTHGEYPAAVRNLCAKENIALIDLKRETRELILSLGETASRELFVNIAPNTDERFPDGIEDKTHFSLVGASAVARMVAENLARLKLI